MRNLQAIDPKERFRKTFDFTFDEKAIAEDTDARGYLTGYASVFGNEDQGGDVITSGAFTKTLAEGLHRKRIKLCDGHNTWGGTKGIIGVVVEAKEDAHGLWVKAQFSSDADAQVVRQKVKDGVLDAMSIGYSVMRYEIDRENEVRKLLELKLYEVSVVAWGMNPEAEIDGVKAAAEAETQRQELAIKSALASFQATLLGQGVKTDAVRRHQGLVITLK